jgi:hypothetical protein|tara:strand:- start:306 stop:1259 length:954 start_codon:yes stop_codon:yes gene_type:complete
MAKKGKTPTPKTQREIMNSQITPYDPPEGAMGFSKTSNPNPTPNFNRGEQVSFRGDTTKPFSLGLKEIDEAIIYYMDNVIKPTVQQNGVVQKVPFIYGSPERWKQVQKDGYYRDLKGKIMMPLITFKRNNIEKVRSLANKLDANNPNNVQMFQKSFSPQNTYNNFSILNNRIPTKQNYAVVMPDYVNITYDFIISTYYIEQLNKVIEAINYASDSYWGNPERYQFKATINNFATPVELVSGGERLVKSTFSLKLYGYIVPDTIQKELTSLKKFNTKSQIIFNMEISSNLDNLDNQNDIIPPRTEIENNNNPTSFEGS